MLVLQCHDSVILNGLNPLVLVSFPSYTAVLAELIHQSDLRMT